MARLWDQPQKVSEGLDGGKWEATSLPMIAHTRRPQGTDHCGEHRAWRKLDLWVSDQKYPGNRSSGEFWMHSLLSWFPAAGMPLKTSPPPWPPAECGRGESQVVEKLGFLGIRRPGLHSPAVGFPACLVSGGSTGVHKRFAITLHIVWASGAACWARDIGGAPGYTRRACLGLSSPRQEGRSPY